MSKEEIPLDLSQEIDKFNQALNITLKVKKYVNDRLKAQESESQKLYEWMLSDKREPAQTYFSSGVIRNIAKEIEFREEKHKEEMEKLVAYLKTRLITINMYENTELIEMFKKSLDIK